MAGPDAAAAAWLARIPEAQRLAAQAATDVRLVAWTAGWLAAIAVCVVLSRSHVFGRFARSIEAQRPRPLLASAAGATICALALTTAMGLVSAIGAWRSDSMLLGVTAPGLLTDLAAAAGGVLPTTLLAILLIPPAHWLMRRRPRTWPPILSGLTLAVILAGGWLPYALSAGPASGPAPAGPVRDGVARLIAEARLPASQVWFSADPQFDADVTGGFGAAKVTLGPMIVAGPATEARAYVGHLMGHYVHNDILIVCLLLGGVLALGMFAMQRFAASLARWLGGGPTIGVADPAALPAMAIIGCATLIIAGLAGAAYLRWANVGADSFSLDHAREPDGLVAVIEREWDHQAVDPSPLAEAVFYTHPPLASRLRHVAVWKAANGG